MRLISLILAVTLAFPAIADERRITVTGTGTATAVPDTGMVQLGVTTFAPSASEALAKNSEQMGQVLAAAKSAGIADTDMQTTQISLHPRWDNQRRDEDQARIVGYQAANSVSLRVRDLAAMGQTIDALSKAGANSINSVGFTIDDTAPLLAEARKAAVADARDKAELYAGAAGVTLGPVMLIRDTPVGAGPQPRMARMEAMASAPPIAAGETEISATVTIVFAIAD